MEQLPLSSPVSNDFSLTPAATRRAFNRVGLGLSLCLVGGALLFLGVCLLLPQDLHQDVLLLLNTLCLDVGGKLLALLFLHALPNAEFEKRTLTPRQWIGVLSIAYMLMYAGNLAGTGLSYLIYPGAENPLLTTLGQDNLTLLTIMDLILFAPVLEELLFRRLLLNKIARWGELPAMVFSGLAFGLFHGNLFQFFYAFLLGMLLAFVYMRTGRILYPILIHAFVNTIGGALPLLLNTMDPSSVPASMLTLLFSVSILALVAVGIVSLWRFFKTFKLNKFPQQGIVRWMYLNPGTILFVLICLLLMLSSLFGTQLLEH